MFPALWDSSAAWLLYLCIIGYAIYYLNAFYLRARTNRLKFLEEQREHEREKHTKEMNMSFFANISHEFRNPITIIAGPLMALNADKRLPASVHQTLDRVCMSVNRMLRLIDQMLDFNQLETDALRLKVSEVDVAQELRQQVAAFEMAASIVNQAVIQCIAIYPNKLTELPQHEIDFLKSVPTTWDETRFVAGYPGKYAVVAR